jgi:hypothetical protein
MPHKRPANLRLARLPVDLTSQLRSMILDLPASVKADYLKKECFSKYVDSNTDSPAIRRNRAIFKWLVCERENESTNERILITNAEYNILPRVSYSKFVSWCRAFIADIIGSEPPLEALIGSFSGGASTSRPRTRSHPSSKYSGMVHSTGPALELFTTRVVSEVPGWINRRTNLLTEAMPGNVLFTVPKKVDIDRVACKEPDLNMFIQKGVGNYFRRCLRRVGINLNDQSINRSFAREGSITKKLATLDLSSASDSVTTAIVSQLLPETWHTLLDSVRSPVTVINGEEHHNQMFSSMGNGFTFELESLLFYTLARATSYFRGTKGSVSIYGDDIICPCDIVPELTSVLSFYGFSVNPDKSFDSGPFRESCGGHYHDGYDITPFYVKGPITTLPDLIDTANKLRLWGSCEVTSLIDPSVEPIWLWLKSFVPKRFWGGEDLSFKYQLVSRDISSHRLSETTKKKSTGDGGYSHWLNATCNRRFSTDGVTTSSKSVGQPTLRQKRVRCPQVPPLDHLFLHEIENDSIGFIRGRGDPLDRSEVLNPRKTDGII